jgi:hypothetical protein
MEFRGDTASQVSPDVLALNAVLSACEEALVNGRGKPSI